MPALESSLRYVHRPPPSADIELLNSGRHPAQRRLAFEELLAHQISLRMLRQAADRDDAWPLPRNADLVERCLAQLPFRLTGAQQRTWHEIEADLARERPMMRLVQGDVGSGKTVVAALAALRAVENGMQAAVMAPTELLAEQHARNFLGWLDPLGVRVGLLTGRQTGKARAALNQDLASGAIQVAVGTHALFQEGMRFDRLALVIVDEQHRFGVDQRMQLREKGLADGRYPHQLVMTATPIPRTLAMTAYADLDVSVIDELPPGRTPIRTVVLPENRRGEIVQRIEAACRAGRQAYWVCPLIDESETLPHQAAEETATALAAALPGVRIGLVHGRMPGGRKDAVMTAFKQGELDLLVATTVIEVGVDVPNASLMVDRERRTHGPRAAAPAARARRPRLASRAAACCSTSRRSRRSPANASPCCATPTTASRWRGGTSSCAAPANCSAPARPGSCSSRSRTWCGTPTCCPRCRRRRH